jgi:hypothetical protein
MNGDNMRNLRYETTKAFRKKRREYLKGKINELQTNNNVNKDQRCVQRHK